jgi:hypothetical protein
MLGALQSRRSARLAHIYYTAVLYQLHYGGCEVLCPRFHKSSRFLSRLALCPWLMFVAMPTVLALTIFFQSLGGIK